MIFCNEKHAPAAHFHEMPAHVVTGVEIVERHKVAIAALWKLRRIAIHEHHGQARFAKRIHHAQIDRLAVFRLLEWCEKNSFHSLSGPGVCQFLRRPVLRESAREDSASALLRCPRDFRAQRIEDFGFAQPVHQQAEGDL